MMKLYGSLLIIDDEVDFCEIIGSALRNECSHITVANSIGEAVQRLLSEKPEIMILDYNLPDGTGLDLVNQFSYLIGDVPIILVTANPTQQIKQNAKDLGINDVLQKPFALTRLRELLWSKRHLE